MPAAGSLKPAGDVVGDPDGAARPLAHGAFLAAEGSGKAALRPAQRSEAFAEAGGGHGLIL